LQPAGNLAPEAGRKDFILQLSELFQRQTWALTGVALKRFRKDRRGRKLVGSVFLIIAALVLVPVVLLAVALGAVLAPQTLTGVPIFIGLALGFGIRLLIQRNRRAAMLDKAAQAISADVRSDMLQITYWLAVLIRRCGSEFALLKEIPPEIQIVTRRVLLDKLKAAEAWQHIPAPARDLLLKPDGHWTEQERAFVAERFEFLTVLRWVLRQDETLRLLSLTPRYDHKRAHELTDKTDWMSAALVRAPAEITARFNSANSFMHRCWVECIVRGLLEVDAETRTRADDFKRKIELDRESTDVLFGSRTIGELPEQELRAVYRRASLRVRLMRGILAEIEGGYVPDRLSGLVVEGLGAAAQTKQAV
jgi:hypothetical protein